LSALEKPPNQKSVSGLEAIFKLNILFPSRLVLQLQISTWKSGHPVLSIFRAISVAVRNALLFKYVMLKNRLEADTEEEPCGEIIHQKAKLSAGALFRASGARTLAPWGTET
jgi:hypothetical protein